jgi:sulfite reductase alpha subunit-like flavoprotein
VKIFYGSQTGTAEDFSHKLAGEGKKYGFAPEVIDMEEYDMVSKVDQQKIIGIGGFTH